MRNPNISGDQFAQVPGAIQGAADTMASEVGSARIYPPSRMHRDPAYPNDPAGPSSSDSWYAEEVGHKHYEDSDEVRAISMHMPDAREPEMMDVGYLDREGAADPSEAMAGWSEAEYATGSNWNAMDDPAAGRAAARTRFGYDSPEWRRRNLRVVR